MPKERIDLLLVRLGICESRQKAQAEILAGNVLVHETPVTKAGTMVPKDAVIRLKEKFPYVSRGALKLIHALDYFHLDVRDKIALDVGSSTGGFTEVLLERGVKMVYAVDSGTNQLDWKLRNNPQVRVMENTNARHLKKEIFNPIPQIAVMDVSFISVTKILPTLIKILEEGFFIVTLIKPQFELEAAKISAKGLVPEKHRSEAVKAVLSQAGAMGLAASEVIESPITGAKSGNVEYLTVFRKNGVSL